MWPQKQLKFFFSFWKSIPSENVFICTSNSNTITLLQVNMVNVLFYRQTVTFKSPVTVMSPPNIRQLSGSPVRRTPDVTSKQRQKVHSASMDSVLSDSTSTSDADLHSSKETTGSETSF